MTVDSTRDDVLDERIHRADLDDLVRLVDDRTASRDWAGLLRARNRCAAAVATGRQLWPVATLAEYRLALWAPTVWCAAVLDEDSGRFTPGPLSEVAAVNHTWADLGPHLTPGPTATYFAHERSLRGESIPDEALAEAVPVIDIPVQRQPWEPEYALARYDDDGVHVDRPTLTVKLEEVPLPAGDPAQRVDDDDTNLAFRQLLDTWTEHSNGRAEVVCVEGNHLEAIAQLGLSTARVAEISRDSALSLLTWAAASGGAHGRRRGTAVGRFGTWWLLAAITDQLDSWPGDPTDEHGAMGEAITGLRWWAWDANEPDDGWRVRLVAQSVEDGLSWVFSADDVA
ncbi:DUF6183 family protein [Ilumatobacteraceae bacterium]|nr:DUF6183 family protein [Ilumatobacteraceae bacterium]